MSDLTAAEQQFWLSGNPTDVRLECVEVTHPAWSRAYRFVSNYDLGDLVVTHEDGLQYTYQYEPVIVQRSGSDNTITQSVELSIAELGALIPAEIERAEQSEFRNEKPTLSFREYVLSDLTQPIRSILGLKIQGYKQTYQGVGISATAQILAETKTGSTYNLREFPTLRGFL